MKITKKDDETLIVYNQNDLIDCKNVPFVDNLTWWHEQVLIDDQLKMRDRGLSEYPDIRVLDHLAYEYGWLVTDKEYKPIIFIAMYEPATYCRLGNVIAFVGHEELTLLNLDTLETNSTYTR